MQASKEWILLYIKNINVKNFTVFENLNIEFCKGINVFIGENGTGKTHLLKMMYAPLSVKNNKSMMMPFWEDISTHNTDVETVPYYFRRNKNDEFRINIDYDNAPQYCNSDGNFSSAIYDVDSVFIPAKVMLL